MNEDYGYTNSYVSDTAPSAGQKAAAPKKRGGVSGGIVAIIVAACIVFGCAAGFVGGTVIGGVIPSIVSAVKDENKNNSNNNNSGTSSGSAASDLTIKEQTGEEISLASVADVVDKTKDSVVVIMTETVQRGTFIGNYVTSGAGSGVIISEDGYIVTCYHVIDSASTITVTLENGGDYPAALIGGDEKTDVALLKIDATGLTPVTFGTSNDLRVGEAAIVIGNPMGLLGGTVTSGIISALDRKVTVEGKEMTLLQTSAAINPGNSGGALFDSAGLLVGLVNAGASEADIEGIGFAIPVDLVKSVIKELKEYGYVTGRPSLGLSLLEITDAFTAMRYNVNYLGVYVLSDSGDFRQGDLIAAIGKNTNVGTISDVSAALDKYNVGDTVEVTVYRNRRSVTIKVELVEYKPSDFNAAA